MRPRPIRKANQAKPMAMKFSVASKTMPAASTRRKIPVPSVVQFRVLVGFVGFVVVDNC